MLTASIAVARALQNDIVGGRYGVGSALPDPEELAARFGTSSACAAQAIEALQRAGFVGVHEQSAVVVATAGADILDDVLDDGMVRKAMEFLTSVEPAAVALAALTVNDADLDRLAGINRRLAQVLDQPEAAVQADIDFHIALAEIAGNEVVVDMLRRELPPVLSLIGSCEAGPASMSDCVEEHEAILLVLRQRDSRSAVAAMQSHLARNATRITALGVQDAGARTGALSRHGEGPHLTQRELDCLRWCAKGKTAWETGRILNISEWTVVYHLSKLKQKLAVRTKRQMIVRAFALGLIETD